MTLTYLDTSAAMKLVVREAETHALSTALAAADERTIIASWLLHAELHCASGRRGGGIPAALIEDVLDTVNLVDLARGDLIAASAYAPLRTNDAIHLAVALRLGATDMITYDHELTTAATDFGIRVISPGAGGVADSEH